MERDRLTMMAAAFGITIALAACHAPTESRMALDERRSAPFDPRLIGAWFAGPEGHEQRAEETAYLYIRATDDAQALDVLAVGVKHRGYDSNDRAGTPVLWFRAEAHASALDGETIYNVRRTGGSDYTPAGDKPGYMLFKARLSEADALTLCLFALRENQTETKRLMDQGRARLMPAVIAGEKAPYYLVDLPRDDLARLVRQAGADAFPCLDVPFRRLG